MFSFDVLLVSFFCVGNNELRNCNGGCYQSNEREHHEPHIPNSVTQASLQFVNFCYLGFPPICQFSYPPHQF